MKKLIAFIFGLLISLSFYADARLVSGTAQHQHDSATGGGATINNTSIGSNSKIAPSIYAYDSAAPSNEKYYKFGNASGDFVLFTYDDTPAAASTVFSITRTGTTPNSFDLGAVSLTSSKACASGFTRIGPNFCLDPDAYPALTTLTRDTCTTVSLPSGSKAIVLQLLVLSRSANVANTLRTARISGYNDSSCITASFSFMNTAYEFNNVVATEISRMEGQIVLPVTSGNARLYFQDDIGDQGLGQYAIVGYYD